jgi:Lar family restriction alleviation protein
MSDQRQPPEITPCPFCGVQNTFIEHMEGTILYPAYRVHCDNCGASSGWTDKGDHIEKWNTRAALEQKP